MALLGWTLSVAMLTCAHGAQDVRNGKDVQDARNSKEGTGMKKIGFSGTLDPITNGHMWVIGEARAMAGEVVVFLSENTLKKPWFSAEQRKHIIEQSTAERGWHNVQVQIVRGSYTAHTAKRAGCDYLIRGIRNTADFDYENLIQQTNVDVLHGAKSIFVMPPRDLGSVSSSFVRALQGPVGWHWHVRKFVPPPAYDAWLRLWLQQEWQQLWPDVDPVQSDALLAQLLGKAHYGAPERHYHNLDHLVHGLSELRVWAAYHECSEAELVQLKKAFWFHDAHYHTGAGGPSDEEASALCWLASDLAKGDGSAAAALDAACVADLIRATDHFQEAGVAHPLKQVMLGADLAILGQDETIYDAYAQAIRLEYQSVPDATFIEHRCRALSHLCQRAEQGQLYRDPYFSELYNQMALENMRREIRQWQTPGAAYAAPA
jgi:pantetheine-phosphate adenylyltransferase